MAQAQANPVTQFFNQFRQQAPAQKPTNGPSNQQQGGKGNQQQTQNVDSSQFKFDPMTGKPVGAGATNNPETQQDPLSAYDGLWKKAEPGKEDIAPAFDLSPDTINAAAEGLDFMGSLPEDINLDGFGEQKETIMKLLNHVARMTYATSMNHQSKLTDKFVGLRFGHEGKQMPKHIRESLTNFTIDNDPAASKSPVIKETMRMVSKQFQQLHPDATPDQITKMAKGFFGDFTKAMNPEMFESPEERNKVQNEAPGGIDFDWSKYAGIEKAA